MGCYATFLDVTERRCLVVGGGQAAAAKAQGLLDAGASVTVVWDHIDPSLRQLDVSIIERRFQGDLEGCFLAIDASGDEATGLRVSRAARARGVLVNVLDRPPLCTLSHQRVPERSGRGHQEGLFRVVGRGCNVPHGTEGSLCRDPRLHPRSGRTPDRGRPNDRSLTLVADRD